MNLIKISKAFTLIEIMVWVLIVSIVMIGWFQALSAVSIWKVRLIQQTDIQKESLYFTQKIFEMVKKWWTIDYEEYFNRKVIWNTTYSSWHFDVESWFWNFWSGWIVWNWFGYWDNFYYCLSWNSISDKMTGTGCFENSWNNYNSDFTWKQQRYGQYSLQFIDYNSNYDNDGTILWDEDWDWDFIWDDDDEYLWDGPEVFNAWDDLKELYLISWNKKERTLFRWNVKLDPDAPWTATCDTTGYTTWSWCIWTIEYLKLDWEDWWMEHSLVWPDNTRFDWVIDTWLIDSDFKNGWVVAWSWIVERVRLFPETINVSEFKVYAYPNKDIRLSWKNADDSVNISPYVVLKFKLKPSWISRKRIQWWWKELDFSMTINLSDIYSQ
jgi:hypothetical protein